jgi:signal transduction histidine kinase
VTINEWFRTIVRRVVAAIAVLRGKAGAVEPDDPESRRLTHELEQANEKLEHALDLANRAQSEGAKQADRLRLLERVSSVLTSSLDYQRTVETTANLAVPALADWCVVDVPVGNQIRQLAASYIHTSELQHITDVRARSTIDTNASTALARVVRTGEIVFAPDVNDRILIEQSRSAEHLELLRHMNIRSGMIVPMVARGHIIGAITMVSTTADRPFDQGSLALAQDIANRAAVAIDNAHLYQTAVVANETKANFLATMSHELRTPLTAVLGYEELLAEGVAGQLTDGQRQQLSRIKASAQHLLALIEEILLYARVEEGRAAVTLEAVQIQAIVDEAMLIVAPTAGHLALAAEVSDPTLTLRTDTGKLRQMLINVIENAVKFAERGQVTVRAYERTTDVVFEVQDTGIGIAPENLERVFEPFWQVDQQKTRRFEGSGLGLSTTRRLARLLGGDVTVESQLGVGSTFRITLPKEPKQRSPLSQH